MKATGEKFEILFDSEIVKVVVYESKGTALYHVQLKDPVFLTKFIDAKEDELWTFIPQSDFSLALKIGKQIDKYTENKNQQTLF